MNTQAAALTQFCLQVKHATAMTDAVAERSDFVRPDIMMKGRRARRASLCAMPQEVSETARMRELTGGNTVWPLRRAATLDGNERLTELYADGRHRQRGVLAYAESFSGAPALHHI